MERDMSARKIYGEEETPEGAAGSEFGKKQREEARRKKFGIVTREFKVEDQPWILKVNGKAGKRWVERLPLSYSPKVLVMQDKIMYYKSYYLEKSRWLDVCKECFFCFFLRFKGIKKGGVTENASYYIFTQCPDGAFEAFPVHGWYNFTPQAKHRTLTAEEAEEEWGRWKGKDGGGLGLKVMKKNEYLKNKYSVDPRC